MTTKNIRAYLTSINANVLVSDSHSLTQDELMAWIGEMDAKGVTRETAIDAIVNWDVLPSKVTVVVEGTSYGSENLPPPPPDSDLPIPQVDLPPDNPVGVDTVGVEAVQSNAEQPPEAASGDVPPEEVPLDDKESTAEEVVGNESVVAPSKGNRK